MWTTSFYKSFSKKIFLYMSSRLSKIRSVQTYVMLRTVYFGWICTSLKVKSVNLFQKHIIHQIKVHLLFESLFDNVRKYKQINSQLFKLFHFSMKATSKFNSIQLSDLVHFLMKTAELKCIWFFKLVHFYEKSWIQIYLTKTDCERPCFDQLKQTHLTAPAVLVTL